MPKGIKVSDADADRDRHHRRRTSSWWARSPRVRAQRAPEPYKGKGVRYSGEIIILKETKKK